MGLSQPGGAGGQPAGVIYAERNSVVTGAANILWDTWYDEVQDEIAYPDDVEAALLAILGLTYNGGTGSFFAEEKGLWLIKLGYNPVAETGAEIKSIQPYTPTYWGSSPSKWGQGLSIQDKPFADLPEDINTTLLFPIFLMPGEQFGFQCFATAGAVDVIDYAALEMFRLL